MSASSDAGPYSHPITFPSGAVRLAGEVLLPADDGCRPAVVLVHGSGAVPRAAHRAIANHFARHGIAALIYDKRGVGDSTGDWRACDFTELGRDALAAIHALAAHPRVDPLRVGLWGISQGAWIAPLVASVAPEVAFLIVVSACGVSPVQQDIFRRARAARSRGHGRPVTILDALWWTLARGAVRLLPASRLPPGEGVRQFKRVFDFEPVPIWERVTQPALAIWGGDDRVVPVGRSARCIAAALWRGGNQDHSLTVFPDADHGLRLTRADGSTLGSPAPFAPGYLELMTDWMRQPADAPPAMSALLPPPLATSIP